MGAGNCRRGGLFRSALGGIRLRGFVNKLGGRRQISIKGFAFKGRVSNSCLGARSNSVRRASLGASFTVGKTNCFAIHVGGNRVNCAEGNGFARGHRKRLMARRKCTILKTGNRTVRTGRSGPGFVVISFGGTSTLRGRNGAVCADGATKARVEDRIIRNVLRKSGASATRGVISLVRASHRFRTGRGILDATGRALDGTMGRLNGV